MTTDIVSKPSINSMKIESKTSKRTEKMSFIKSKDRKTPVTKSERVSCNQIPSPALMPIHFNNILSTFVSLDVVVNKLIKQRNCLYIDRIAEILKQMNIKNFDAKVFGQILKILPESYSYEFDNPPLKITRHYKEKIKIIPNLSYGNQLDSTPKIPEKCFRLDQLMIRRTHFHDRLLEIVRDKHNEFLTNTKNFSKEEIEKFSVDKKWHAEFNMEIDVEPIESIQLDKNSLKSLKNSLVKNSKLSIPRLSKGDSLIVSNSNKISQTMSSSQQSPLSEFSGLQIGTINKKNTSVTNIGKENRKPMKLSNNQNLSTEIVKENDQSISSKCPLKDSVTNNKFIYESPLIKINIQSKVSLTDKSIQQKSLKMPVQVTFEETLKSNGESKSPLRKSVNSSLKTTPRLSNNQRNFPSNKITPNSVSKSPNQSRLSFISSGTPKGNFIANLSVPNSPMLKNEFFLKQKLPSHLKVLFELFSNLEDLIYVNRRKSQVTYLSMSTTSTKYNLTESQLGRILKIYPQAYSVKWETILSKNMTKNMKKIDIAIRPKLEESFLKFDCYTIKQRKQTFLGNCFQIVVSSYREFLIKNNINFDNIEDHIKNGDWNNNFNIDLHVKTIEPILMPEKSIQKELINSRLTFSIVKNRPTVDLNSKVSPKNNEKLNSLSKSLVDKVKMNKAKNSIICRLPNKRNVIVSELPEMAAVIANEFKLHQNKPLTKSQIANIVCNSLKIKESSFDEYLNIFIESVPGWIEILNWAVPTLSIVKSELIYDEVIAILKKKIAEQRI